MLTNNQYLFPYTQGSSFQVTGYNEIKKICDDLKMPVITATANRHRMSTRLWQLDVSDEQVNSFMEHLGHSVEAAGVLTNNQYLFPYTQGSSFQVTGYNEIN